MIKKLIKNIFTSLLTRIQALEYSMGLIADYVVETGTSGSWKYSKWESGKAECQAQLAITKSGNSTTMLGLNGYVYESGAIPLPLTFSSTPMALFDGNVGAQNTVIAYSRVSTNDCAVEMVIGGSGSRVMNISVQVIGRWK